MKNAIRPICKPVSIIVFKKPRDCMFKKPRSNIPLSVTGQQTFRSIYFFALIFLSHSVLLCSPVT